MVPYLFVRRKGCSRQEWPPGTAQPFLRVPRHPPGTPDTSRLPVPNPKTALPRGLTYRSTELPFGKQCGVPVSENLHRTPVEKSSVGPCRSSSRACLERTVLLGCSHPDWRLGSIGTNLRLQWYGCDLTSWSQDVTVGAFGSLRCGRCHRDDWWCADVDDALSEPGQASP